MYFHDRVDAGRQLAAKLLGYAGRADVVVLGLPRGGVPVAAEIAKPLQAPVDVFLVRKLGVPGQTELAMGAIAEGDVQVLHADLIEQLGISPEQVQEVAAGARAEIERRNHLYRDGRAPAPVRDHVVILADDGLATGATMEAAIASLRRLQPARIVVAVPVGAADTCARIAQLADELVCLAMPEPFQAVGLWYDDFSETTDDDVRRLLRPSSPSVQSVVVDTGRCSLQGELRLPRKASGMVLFAHGSGSSRHSPRNQAVGRVLERHRLGTLLIDLLTEDEGRVDDQTGELRFDIPLLAARLVGIIDWLRGNHETASLPIGLFGASTGAGAALLAAAQRPHDVAAVVSRGGRPDLAGPALQKVTTPSLLIVGGDDTAVIEMNREAMAQMRDAEVEIEIVPGASHLFEEPGTLERVAELAADWFGRYLQRPGR